MTSKPFTTFLWLDHQSEEAARYYVSIFKNSRLGAIHRYTSAGPGEEGSVMLVEFELNGQRFAALNGGPQYTFTPAVSFVVECADQAEVDYYWDRLAEGGQPGIETYAPNAHDHVNYASYKCVKSSRSWNYRAGEPDARRNVSGTVAA